MLNNPSGTSFFHDFCVLYLGPSARTCNFYEVSLDFIFKIILSNFCRIQPSTNMLDRATIAALDLLFVPATLTTYLIISIHRHRLKSIFKDIYNLILLTPTAFPVYIYLNVFLKIVSIFFNFFITVFIFPFKNSKNRNPWLEFLYNSFYDGNLLILSGFSLLVSHLYNIYALGLENINQNLMISCKLNKKSQVLNLLARRQKITKTFSEMNIMLGPALFFMILISVSEFSFGAFLILKKDFELGEMFYLITYLGNIWSILSSTTWVRDQVI